MKIWICGSKGLVGSYLEELLGKNTLNFVSTTKSEIDVTDFDAVSEFVRKQKISHVVNCSGYSQIDQAEKEPKVAYALNAFGPHNLAIATRRHGASLVHLSSHLVFDGQSPFPYEEEDPVCPIGSYGFSKVVGEVKIMEEHKHPCVIRTSWVFGHPEKDFYHQELFLEDGKITSGSKPQIARPTYAGDLAQAILDLIDAEGVFHFANGGETTADEFYRTLNELSASPVELIHKERIASRPVYGSLNTLNTEEYLSKPIRPWKEALEEYMSARALLCR